MPWRNIAFTAYLILWLLVVPATFANKKPPAAPVNLNTATSEQLQEVPGIGPSTADKILQMRKSYGAFKSVNDLLAIRGIGPKRLEKMRKYLAVGKPATARPAPPAKKPATDSAAAKKPPSVAKPETEANDDEEPQ
jgi:competence ComEA-like helix-hairpin-helix protein